MFDFNKDLQLFVEKVIPKNAGKIQIEEIRKAFISGAKITAFRALEDKNFMDYIEEIDEMFEFIIDKKA